MKTYYISNQQEIGRDVYDLSVLDTITDDIIGCDTETTGLDPFTLTPILLGISTTTAYYIINLLTFDAQTIEKVLKKFEKKLWIFHNAKYDLKVLKVHYNVLLKNVYCTYVNSQIIYNGCDALKHSYDAVVERFFKVKVDKTQRNSFIDRNLLEPITTEEINYLVEDLNYLISIYERQLKALEQFDLLECSKLENNYLSTLTQIELNGIRLDSLQWKKNTENYNIKVKDLESRLKQEFNNLIKLYPDVFTTKLSDKKIQNKQQLSLFGTETLKTEKITEALNISSSTQILSILHKCDISLPDTNEETLNSFLLQNPNHQVADFIKILLQHREFKKLVSTYGENFLKYINPVTGLIHCDYFQNLTATGRLSCTSPNIQNIPAIDEIRACFVPDTEDYVFVDCDMSGQELRLAASASNDKILLDSFNEGLDLHSYLAQDSFKIIYNDPKFVVSKSVNGNLRDAHKPVLFGFLYGAGANRIAQVLNIDKELAKRVYKKLRYNLPVLSQYQEKLKKIVLANMSIRDGSIINRVKHFNIHVTKKQEDYEVEKQGINFPIQSTGASLMKDAGIEIQKFIDTNQLDCQIKAQVHDEYLVQIPKNQLWIGEEIRKIMENVGSKYLTGVKMKSTMVIADCWKH